MNKAAASTTTSGTPSAPSSLAASSASSSSIKVSWKDNASNEGGFVLERSTSSNFSGSVARINIPANSTSYTDKNKSTGVKFYYRIKAVSGSSSSAFSNVSSAAAGSASSSDNTADGSTSSTGLNAPSSLQASSSSSTSISLNWKDNAGSEDSFILERSPSSSFSGSGASIKLPANATTYLDNNKQAGVTYYYRVKAVKGSQSSSWSNVISASVGSGSTSTANQAPTVNAGSDKTITLPTNSLTLSGSARDSDGSITSYKWTKVNGASATLSGTTTTSLKLSNLVEGSYTFRLTVTDNKNAQAYDEVRVTVNKSGTSTTSTTAGTPVYRINAGGNSNLSASPIQWDMDNQSNPSRYLSSSSSNNTAGSNSWNGTNNTKAPSAIFGPIRFDFSWGGAMQYKLPVKNGTYEVRLYFAETPYSGGVSGSGQRVFDIKLEGQTKVSGLDIYKEAGMNALQKTVTISVTDGTLDIDFVRKIGNPQINGIEVLTSTSGARTANTEMSNELELHPEAGLSIYPNPVDSEINLRFGKELSSNAKVQLIGMSGEMLLQETLQGDGQQQTQIDISNLQLSPGIYLLKVQEQGAPEQVVKLLKN